MKFFVVLVLAFVAFKSISAEPIPGSYMGTTYSSSDHTPSSYSDYSPDSYSDYSPGSAPSSEGPPNSGYICDVTPGQISALTPLLNKFGLAPTVNGVKQLAIQILKLTGGIVNGLTGSVNKLVTGLLGVNLNLNNILNVLAEIISKQLPCLLDRILPLP